MSFKRIILITVLGVSALTLIVRLGFKPAQNFLGFQARAGLKVNSAPEATIFINGNQSGKTPYQNNDLRAGEYQVKLVEGAARWEGKITLNTGTLSVVNRELAESVASSSGEVLTLTPGSGVIISSTPDKAMVNIDGKSYGQTPLSVSDLVPGEHTFILSHGSYLERSIRAVLPEKKVLNIAVDLALTETNPAVSLTPVVASTPKVVILQTPTGFLRVRDKPSLSGNEISRVSSGEIVTLLEETTGWDKVKLKDGTEGYVSSSYTQKQP